MINFFNLSTEVSLFHLFDAFDRGLHYIWNIARIRDDLGEFLLRMGHLSMLILLDFMDRECVPTTMRLRLRRALELEPEDYLTLSGQRKEK